MRSKKILLITVLISALMIGCGEQGVNEGDEYELELTNEERFFKSQVDIKSEAEEVIMDALKVEISDNYDEFKNIYSDIEVFDNYSEIYQREFEEGKYTKEIIVNNLKELIEEEYVSNPDDIKYYDYMDRLEVYNPSEFKIIEVEYTREVTDELDKVAQWGSGEWVRYYVVVKEEDDSDWRIYDIYGHM